MHYELHYLPELNIQEGHHPDVDGQNLWEPSEQNKALWDQQTAAEPEESTLLPKVKSVKPSSVNAKAGQKQDSQSSTAPSKATCFSELEMSSHPQVRLVNKKNERQHCCCM